MHRNHLYFGDNLDVLHQHIKDESVDLVYLDPPFNSNRNYSVIFNKHQQDSGEHTAQIQAFEDTWRWTLSTDIALTTFVSTAPQKAADALSAFYTLLGEGDALAYLVNMAPRLLQLHRVLKPTGSLYLHCDPTMSHYLKILLDAIFGVENFRNEIAWKRTGAHSSAKKFGPVHDTILYFARSKAAKWNGSRVEHSKDYLDKYYRYDDGDGRLHWRNSLTAAGTRNGSSGQPWRGFDVSASGQHWKYTTEKLDALDAEGKIYWPPGGRGFPQIKRYRDELNGAAVGDIWDDIDKLNPRSAERLGYPTQKPVALLERILKASSNEGDVVLDPFCGCGTTVDAAQRLGRRWIGIDITFIAVDLITKRLRHTYGESVEQSYAVTGIPVDVAGARALFAQSPFEFERWAVSLVNAEPNQRQVGDKGIDGVARFPINKKDLRKVLISVKGGKTLNPSMVRDLRGTVDRTPGAEMGVLVTLSPATRGVLDEINHGGVYTHPANGQAFPRLQHVTIAQLLQGRAPTLPPTVLPYIPAARHVLPAAVEALF